MNLNGPGKYDDLCTDARKAAQAAGGVVLIVLGGHRGDGFSAQLPTPNDLIRLPAILRRVADEIEAAAYGGQH